MQKRLELTCCLLLSVSVPLLDTASALYAHAVGLTLRIMGELAPLFFYFPAQLLPVTFQTIPVHVDLLPLFIDACVLHAIYQRTDCLLPDT